MMAAARAQACIGGYNSYKIMPCDNYACHLITQWRAASGSADMRALACNGGCSSMPRDSHARHSIIQQRAASGSADTLAKCVFAAAATCRVTVMPVIHLFDGALLQVAYMRAHA